MPNRSLVLLAEDEFFIGTAIIVELEAASFEVAGPFMTCVGAMAWLSARSPDCAVLDIKLSDGPCTDLALELHRRGIPIVVHSAYKREGVPAIFQTASWVGKPALAEAVVSAVVEALQRSSG